VRRAEPSSYGRRSLPPAGGVGVAVGAGIHGVSDPAVRARRGPARALTGRSRHGCPCRHQCSRWLGGRRETPCGAPWNKRVRVHIIRTIWSRNFREMCGMRVPSSRPCRRSFDSGNGPGKRTACDVDLASSLADARTIMLDADGHHDDDAASVLGTVQGSPLRSDRASARPSGLDGACAQMISRQLRDGPRMLSASGTHSTFERIN